MHFIQTFIVILNPFPVFIYICAVSLIDTLHGRLERKALEFDLNDLTDCPLVCSFWKKPAETGSL